LRRARGRGPRPAPRAPAALRLGRALPRGDAGGAGGRPRCPGEDGALDLRPAAQSRPGLEPSPSIGGTRVSDPFVDATGRYPEGRNMEGRTLTPSRAPQRATSGLGNRLRQLRVAAGLTQSELASDRFSKEYVSQIERGKTRPTQETLAWIAERLGVDVSYLETGQSWDEYAEAEATVVRAEAAVEGQRFDEALEALGGLQYSPEAQELEFRA